MSVVLSIVLWILAIALGLIALVVLTPLHLQGEGGADDEGADGRAQVRWGWWLLMLRADSETGVDARVFGLRVWRYRPGQSKAASPEKAAAKAAKKAAKKAKKQAKAKRGGRAGAAWANRRALFRLIGTVAHSIPVRGHVFGTIGLSDPADTGALFALLDRLAERSHVIEVDVWPDWIDETFALEGKISVRLWPAQVLAALLWLVIRDGQTRRGLRAMFQSS